MHVPVRLPSVPALYLLLLPCLLLLLAAPLSCATDAGAGAGAAAPLDAPHSPPFLTIPLARRPLAAARAFSHQHRPWAAHLTRPSAPFRRHATLPPDWHNHLRTPLFAAPSIPPHPFSAPHTSPAPNVTRVSVAAVGAAAAVGADAAAAADTAAAAQLPQQPLHGGIVSLGEYFITLSVGGQPINVQLDTGSSTLAVPLKDCLNCRPHDHRLDLARAQGTAGFIACDAPACTPNSCKRYPVCTQCSRRTRACCSVAAPDACGFYLLYADQSGASGALVQADVALAGLTVPLVFGAILRETPAFENTNVDGIFGMAYSSLACNPTCVDPLFDTLIKQGKVKHDIFSICTGENGGSLTLGASDPNQYEGNLKYAPMVEKKQRHFYDVKVRQVSIGGQKITVPDFDNAIIDSGTTLLVLAPSAYLAIKRHFQQHYCHVPGLCAAGYGKEVSPEARIIKKPDTLHDPNHNDNDDDNDDDDHLRAAERGFSADPSWFNPGYCVRLDDKHVDMLPDISIGLGNGVELVVDPQTYMLKYETDSTFAWEKIMYRCLGVSPLESLDLMENNAIIGNSVLQKYFVEYDRENNRLGFALAKNCVDPSAKMLGAGVVLGDVEPAFLPRWILGLLMMASVVAWVVLIAFCAKESRKRSGYRQIPDATAS